MERVIPRKTLNRNSNTGASHNQTTNKRPKAAGYEAPTTKAARKTSVDTDPRPSTSTVPPNNRLTAVKATQPNESSMATTSEQTPPRVGHQRNITTARKTANNAPNTGNRRRSTMIPEMAPSPLLPVKTRPRISTLYSRDVWDSDDDAHTGGRRAKHPTAAAATSIHRRRGVHDRRGTTEDMQELRGYLDANLNISHPELPRNDDATNDAKSVVARKARKRPDTRVESGDSSPEPVVVEIEANLDDPDDIQFIDPPIRPIQIPSVIQLPPLPSSRTLTIVDTPTPELICALKSSILRLPQSRLPFLRRNLRRGFALRCRKKGITTVKQTANTLRAIYICHESAETGYARELAGWECPMCSLFPSGFESREMLKQHLEWDHGDVTLIWRNLGAHKWIVELRLPDSSLRPLEPDLNPSFAYASYKQPVSRRSRTLSLDYDRIPSNEKGKGRAFPTIPFPESREVSAATTEIVDPDAESIPTKKLFIPTAISPSPPRPLSPQEIFLKPLAQPPFLPATSEDGKIAINYSCRPGGPKIYDLLGTLPLDEFGVLKWAVIDREEEIFEVDDLKDEYKVMHALWARWIMLNRTTFVANYGEGAKLFVDKYWKMIRLAAGWEALRYWLLLLLAHKYLTGKDVADTLKHYERKVGMDSEDL